MKIVRTIKQLRRLIQTAKRNGKTIGFVPTMGALHKGHAVLMRRCRKANDLAVLSIFINPKQFGPKEDFKRYPRNKQKDISLAKKENIDIIFYPSVVEMYPPGFCSYIEVEHLTDVLCGKFRPGHFRGVATVVGKLLNLVTPDTLYLGQKDAQQCAVIKQMIRDLNLNINANIVPTVRETDGLAMSSRNTYLTDQQRREAPILYQALQLAQQRIRRGEHRTQTICAIIRRLIQNKTSGTIQYIDCVDAQTLTPLRKLHGSVLIALAVWFGKTRLIDNVTVKAK